MLKMGGCRIWGKFIKKRPIINGIFRHFCFKFSQATKVAGSKPFKGGGIIREILVDFLGKNEYPLPY